MKISTLNIFPIKSTAGISLTESSVSLRGLNLDRNWTLIDENSKAITGRENAKLFNIRTSLSADGLVISRQDEQLFTIPYEPEITQVTELKVFDEPATGMAVSADVDAWFSDYLEAPCRLIGMNTDVHRRMITYEGDQTNHPVAYSDACPVLVVSKASLDDLNGRLETPVSMARFRPNIVISGCDAFEEDSWKNIRIRSVTYKSLWQCRRCIMTIHAPDTCERHPQNEPLRTMATYRRPPGGSGSPVFGMLYAPQGEGNIAVGDTVEVLS